MSTIHTRLAGVAAHLPETTMTTAELEDRLAARNPGLELPRGVIHNGSGVRRRHLAAPHEKPSDLAVHAARRLLAEHDLRAHDLDLIMFAGVSVDLIEPATAHIVAAKLGASCPVFDVRNACNSVLNAIEVADAFIAAGRYRRILICCGELPSAFMPWTLPSAEEFFTVGAAYTVSDAGAALLLEAATTPGVLGHRFAAHSAGWDAAVVPLLNMTSDPAADWPALRPLTVDAVQAGARHRGDRPRRLPQAARRARPDLGRFRGHLRAPGVAAALWRFCDHVGSRRARSSSPSPGTATSSRRRCPSSSPRRSRPGGCGVVTWSRWWAWPAGSAPASSWCGGDAGAARHRPAGQRAPHPGRTLGPRPARRRRLPGRRPAPRGRQLRGDGPRRCGRPRPPWPMPGYGTARGPWCWCSRAWSSGCWRCRCCGWARCR